MSVSDFYKCPMLRQAAQISWEEARATIDFRGWGCTLDFEPAARSSLATLFELLGRGVERSELQGRLPELQVDRILDELDRSGLLTEGASLQLPPGMSGAAHHADLRRFADAAARKIASDRFHQAMATGEVTRAQLIGYAIEYYLLVRETPGLVGSALGHRKTPGARRLLERFVAEELFHYEMLGRALASVGIGPAVLEERVPLWPTFGCISTLGVLAAQDYVSFASILFLFEQPASRFNQAFREAGRRLDLPPAFLEPILEHADENEEGGHEDISRLLLEEIPWVSEEESDVARKHVVATLELLVRMEEAILDHYVDRS